MAAALPISGPISDKLVRKEAEAKAEVATKEAEQAKLAAMKFKDYCDLFSIEPDVSKSSDLFILEVPNDLLNDADLAASLESRLPSYGALHTHTFSYTTLYVISYPAESGTEKFDELLKYFLPIPEGKALKYKFFYYGGTASTRQLFVNGHFLNNADYESQFFSRGIKLTSISNRIADYNIGSYLHFNLISDFKLIDFSGKPLALNDNYQIHFEFNYEDKSIKLYKDQFENLGVKLIVSYIKICISLPVLQDLIGHLEGDVSPLRELLKKHLGPASAHVPEAPKAPGL